LNNLDKAVSVQKIQDYIYNNLNNELDLEKLSNIVGYSKRHTVRIFKELTDKTPIEYIRQLRLTEAARILKDKKIKIIDVAFNFLFDSHEGFTKAFSKQFGISPHLYNKEPVPVKYFIPYSSLIGYRYKNGGNNYMEKKTNSIFVQVVERPKRKAIIKRGIKAEEYFAYCDEVGCDIWGILESIKDALYEPVGFWLNDSLIKEGTSKYVQGVEVSFDYKGKIPEGFDLIELDSCKMMVFHSQPFNDEDFEEAIIDTQKAIEVFNAEIYGYNWANNSPRFQLSPIGKRGYIEARPVKEI
jgi:AraC-like DNA-binding protein